MKKCFVFILVLFSISCTKSSPPHEAETKPTTEVTAKTEVAPKSEEIPTLKVDAADKSCGQDSDCERVGTDCSCGCGDAVNKTNIEKYNTQHESMCKDYKGPMCKVNCTGTVKCVEKVCTYN